MICDTLYFGGMLISIGSLGAKKGANTIARKTISIMASPIKA